MNHNEMQVWATVVIAINAVVTTLLIWFQQSSERNFRTQLRNLYESIVISTVCASGRGQGAIDDFKRYRRDIKFTDEQIYRNAEK